jgi:DNA-binding beta-propeller fold protein YncE
MPLTTVAEGRVYDWSHAVGHNAQRGPGFTYVQTLCLGKNGVVYAANRGGENNFAMRVNKMQIGGPGEEEWLADLCLYGEGDGTCTRPFGVASDDNDHVYVSDDWRNTISVFDSSGKFLRQWGQTGSGDGELFRPAGLAVDKNGNIIVVDSGNDRLQVFTPDGTFVGKCGRTGNGDGEFREPWGITLDKDGNIYVADWKNHRVQKLSPEGKFLMKFGEYGKVATPEGAFAVTHFGPWVAATSESAHYPKPGLLNHPTDVAIDPDGDIYVSDWGNHRVCIFDADGRAICNLIGDAQILSKWAQARVDANPDMAKARRRVKSLEPQWRFCFPTAVEFDPESDRIIVADSMRNRLQIYQKVRNYSDFQANL